MDDSKRNVFFRRLSVTIGLWVLVGVAVTLRQDWFYALLIGGAALMALREFYALVLAQGAKVFPKLGLVGAAVYLVASFFWLHDADAAVWFDTAFVAGFVFVVFLRQMMLPVTEREPLEGVAYTFFGFLYIPWLFNFVAKILFMVPRGEDGSLIGIYYVLFLLVVTKFSDMGAYTFGSLFGRHRFVPHISPKKTWEGVAGAIVASFVGAWGVYALAASHLAVLRFGDVALLALLLGVAAIAGDLAASVLKRSAAIKDSSNVLPGIGGTLDLIDSLLFAAPIFYFYLRCIAG